MKVTVRSLVSLIVVLAAACAEELKAPTAKAAVAGGATDVAVGSVVQLSGKDSSDPQKKTIAYRWTLTPPGGSTATLTDVGVEGPSFVADVAGVYKAALRVSNGLKVSEESLVEITAKEGLCGSRAPNIADISTSPASVGTGDRVTLTATVSDDDNESTCAKGQTVSLFWELTTLPAASNAALNSSTADNPSFTADAPGDYGIRLTATDSTGRKTTSTKTVTAASCGNATPVVVSVDPSPSTANPGTVINLAAVVSDADNDVGCGKTDTFKYEWSLTQLPPTSAARLNDPAMSTPSFVADVGLGTYQVQLVVTDRLGHRSDPKTATVTTNSCGGAAPSASASVATTNLQLGRPVVFAAGPITDTDTEASCGVSELFTYRWELTDHPVTSAAALDNPNSSRTSLVPDVDGEYTATLWVTDRAGHVSAGASATADLSGACGGATPTLTTITPNTGSLNRNETLTLRSNADDADDACGEVLAYFWKVVQTSSTAPFLLGADTPQPTLVPRSNSSGNYTVQVYVVDSTGRFSSPTVTSGNFNVKTCGASTPTVNAITPASASINRNQTLILGSDAEDSDFGCGDTLNYFWSVVQTGADAPTLAGANTPSPTLVPSATSAGDYQVELYVTDATGQKSGTATSGNINVAACGAADPTLTSVTASAANVNRNAILTLGSNAADADTACGDTLAYSWSIVPLTGSGAYLTEATSPNPIFHPEKSNAGTYQVRLTITDSTHRSAGPVLSSTITVNTCGGNAPTLSGISPSAGNTNVNSGGLLPLSVNATDADTGCGAGDFLTYNWTLAGPAGAFLTETNSPDPVFHAGTAAASSIFTARVYAVDSTGRASSAVTTGNITVTACGSNTPSVTVSPSAATVNSGGSLVLGSTVLDGDTSGSCTLSESFTYAWTLSGTTSGAFLTEASSPSAIFNAGTATSGIYTAKLVVTDAAGHVSSPATATITMSPCGSNPPSVTISPTSATVLAGASRFLTSTVLDGDTSGSCTLTESFTYNWTLTGTTSGAFLTEASSPAAIFNAGTATSGTYTARLVVTDAAGHASSAATASITMSACGSNTPTVTVSPSAATVNSGRSLVLGSTVQDGDTSGSCTLAESFTYAWTLSGTTSGAFLTEASSPSAIFNAGTATSGTYTARLVVTDSDGHVSSPATATITMSACGSNVPSATISPSAASVDANRSLVLGSTVLDGDTSGTCTLTESFTYLWTLSGPAGTTLSETTGPAAIFTAGTTAGAATVRLVVTDSAGHASSAATAAITVTSCGTNTPSATISPSSATVPPGQRLPLSSTVLDGDTSGTCTLTESFTYSWTLTRQGGTGVGGAVLFDSTSPSAIFDAGTAGGGSTWKAKLVVTDSTGRSSSQASQSGVITISTCGATTPAVTVAGRMLGGGSVAGPSYPGALAGQTIMLSATVTDNDVSGCGDVVNTQWSLTSRPDGSQAGIGNVSGLASEITLDVPGTYVVTATASDSTGRFKSAALTIQATEPRYQIKKAGTAQFGLYHQLKLDSSDDPHMVWVDSAEKSFMYAKCNSTGSCENSDTDAVFAVSEATELAWTDRLPSDAIRTMGLEPQPLALVLVNNVPAVFYMAVDGNKCELRYSYRHTSGAWHTAKVVDNTLASDTTCINVTKSYTGAWIAAAVVGSGTASRPVVVWSSKSGADQKLFYSYCDNAAATDCAAGATGTPVSFAAPTVLDPGASLGSVAFVNPSLALKGGTTPGLAYVKVGLTGGVGTNSALYYGSCPSTDGCTDTTATGLWAGMVPPTTRADAKTGTYTFVSGFASLAYEPASSGGLPRIAYMDGGPSALSLTRCTGPAALCDTDDKVWVSMTLDSGGSGRWANLVIDSTGQYYIGHARSAGRLDLMVLDPGTLAMRSGVVDRSAVVGFWPSMAYSSTEGLRFLYLDFSRLQSKYYPLP